MKALRFIFAKKNVVQFPISFSCIALPEVEDICPQRVFLINIVNDWKFFMKIKIT